ncbi:RASSF7_8 [Lepeophtheirus salmonis]|uniref:RASSF7_8 n=2 Tax=Lepeophtheirus salmonis TaxID=72036 RepID=A0A7R8CRT1_LEPSM|nr:RASSF7_8 [Lepeophtheirus salmonis]CAF2908058.1 RASSF7_8 [Lepeophtheirus salmonis]
MRSMSIEKSKQKEQELMSEVEKLHEEIKSLQKSSEEGANISQHLSVEVQEMEEQIRQRKSEVEKLIQEMREVNMETLVISPPEESKQFLDAYVNYCIGPPRPGSSRKMLGSPRQLENAVPTSKNPHGVWV